MCLKLVKVYIRCMNKWSNIPSVIKNDFRDIIEKPTFTSPFRPLYEDGTPFPSREPSIYTDNKGNYSKNGTDPSYPLEWFGVNAYDWVH